MQDGEEIQKQDNLVNWSEREEDEEDNEENDEEQYADENYNNHQER